MATHTVELTELNRSLFVKDNILCLPFKIQKEFDLTGGLDSRIQLHSMPFWHMPSSNTSNCCYKPNLFSDRTGYYFSIFVTEVDHEHIILS